MLSPRVSLCLLACVLTVACDKASSQSAPSPAADPPAESWAAQPPAQWPQLVLTNATKFKGHSSLNGASSFLVRSADGRVLAATALHLIGPNGGVEPKIAPEELPAALVSWNMFPRTKTANSVAISGLGCKFPLKKNVDWLILTVAGTNLPSTPLTMRARPVSVGENIFLVGVPYSEPDRVQNVYRGRVTARAFGDRFRYTVDPPVDIRGFSGAPILDEHGLVVGVMTVWFDPKMEGENFLEAGGEDAAAALDAMSASPSQ
jgi:hypothetical protein